MDFFPSKIRITTQQIMMEKEHFPDYADRQNNLTREFELINMDNIDPWQRVAFATVFRACIDYKQLKTSYEVGACQHKMAALRHEMTDIEEFLMSKYARRLIGGNRDFSFLTPEYLDTIPTAVLERALRHISGAGD